VKYGLDSSFGIQLSLVQPSARLLEDLAKRGSRPHNHSEHRAGDRTGHVLQFAIAVGRTGQAVQRMSEM